MNSREIEQAAVECWNFLKMEDQPAQAVVIFILGGSSLAPVDRARELWVARFAPKIAFISTGGTFGGEKVWGIPENEKYQEVLLANGVPENNLITQGLTTNTLMEAQTAIPFLKENGVDPGILILVSRPIHQRRAWATFMKQHPQVQYLNCPGREALETTDEDARKRMVQEIDRLQLYGGKGDIVKQEIPEFILEATEVIRRSVTSW